MLRPDLDRYYTPPAVARQLVELCGATGAAKVLDTTCGDGSLLLAARDVLSGVQCVGMDWDRATVERLRRREPDWILSRADALSSAAWRRAVAGRHGVGSDLVLLNPPFSMATGKGTVIALAAFSGRCSVAMAHLLAALSRATPARCAAVVPESLMFSDLDARARAHLSESYKIVVVRGLRNSTFRGARANALMVSFKRRAHPSGTVSALPAPKTPASFSLVRGGLPLFEAVPQRRGLHYVHSTELSAIADGASLRSVRRVRPIARGVVSGHVVMFPRVGVPSLNSVKAVWLSERVQLSDCVIALCFGSRAAAIRWERLVRDRWRRLGSLYRGTGARYTTVQRLREWLWEVERDSGVLQR